MILIVVYLQNAVHQFSIVVLLCQYDLSKFHAAIKILRGENLNDVFMLKLGSIGFKIM